MSIQLRALLLVLSLGCFSVFAEEKPTPQEAVVSLRAAKRLIFETPVYQTPGGGGGPVPVFVFHRSGDTNRALLVEFSLTGMAGLGTDYTRALVEPSAGPGIVATGSVQSVYFAPGQVVQYAQFAVVLDDLPERAEFIRLSLLQPRQNGIAAPDYRLGTRRCATVWISNQKRCLRSVITPSGGRTCVEFRPIILPRAFFTTARCR